MLSRYSLGKMASVQTLTMSIKLNGILLPVTTPFLANEDVDTEGLKRNLATWNSTGVIGYVVLGSTGERANLDEAEYRLVIETARDVVPDELTFIAGAGQQSTRGTIREIQAAVKVGADAVLVITPSFYKSALTQDALITHYQAVADSSTVPVILYSMPDLTGIKIEPETAARLSEHPNIIGMKDSSNDVAKFAETVRLTGNDFAVMIGNGTVLCETLQAGATGGILAVGCVAPRLCIEIYQAVQAGHMDQARGLQDKLTPLARAVTKTYSIGGLKTAMEMVGLIGGNVRAPLQRPSQAATDEIAQLLKDANSTSASSAGI